MPLTVEHFVQSRFLRCRSDPRPRGESERDSLLADQSGQDFPFGEGLKSPGQHHRPKPRTLRCDASRRLRAVGFRPSLQTTTVRTSQRYDPHQERASFSCANPSVRSGDCAYGRSGNAVEGPAIVHKRAPPADASQPAAPANDGRKPAIPTAKPKCSRTWVNDGQEASSDIKTFVARMMRPPGGVRRLEDLKRLEENKPGLRRRDPSHGVPFASYHAPFLGSVPN